MYSSIFLWGSGIYDGVCLCEEGGGEEKGKEGGVISVHCVCAIVGSGDSFQLRLVGRRWDFLSGHLPQP